MARGTNVSNVNFSIPEGADPMGIGIPDLGKSSYDPIETIKRGWEKDREDRAIKNAERREDWKAQKKAIPTFESVNAKVAGILNQKAVKLGSYVDQQYKAGMFAPWAKSGEVDKDGKRTSTWQEVQRLESELASEGEAYNALLPKYKAAQAIVSDPKNESLIDWDVTNKRMKQFAEAKDLQGMSEASSKLYAFKPKPVDMMNEVTARLKSYLPEETVAEITRSWDPLLNKFKIDETTPGVDQTKLAQAMLKVYDDLAIEKNEFINDVHRRYELAPKREKETDDGVPIDEKAWWVGRYVPAYNDKIKTTYVAKGSDSTTNDGKPVFKAESMITIPKDDKGMYQFTEGVTTTIASLKEGSFAPTMKNYSVAATVELSGVSDKTFPVKTTANVTDQQLGNKIPEGMVVFEQPVNNQLLPAASSDITFKGTTIKKGEPIDEELYAQKDFPQNKAEWDWFTTSNSQLKKAKDEYENLGAGYNLTTVRPWKEIRNALLQEVSGKFDLRSMDREMEEIKRQKNLQRTVKTEEQKKKEEGQILDDILQGAFKM